LRAYDWPGNVRELRNAVERAAVLAVGPVIEEGDLPARVVEHRVVNEDVRRYSIVAPILPDLPAVEGDLRRQLTDHQRRVVLAALEATGWNRAEAATRLGLPVRTLAHRMKVIGIRRPER
jgi:DNA-binding NtrC family response regulator